MERKVGSSTLTAKEVKAALEKSTTLTAEEEKALRMRHGAGAPSKSAPLPRAAGANAELADELLVIEMQLMKAMRARTAAKATKAPAAVHTREAPANAAKDKIVRALRAKKK
ncbi:hypothetical protein [Corallococcus carmarthensis]|uniref:Uncharacterized protein n=1 Tax=Corallococcus carmarthensis TaxID=2316728 RepID=A0A3A8JMA4_9BACT|nr:hypothetical protein [Corallococcus carmarthensis]NOK22697.1 hypothetical protein [Corallococcus carmarthensis]RKG96148.1 hypothetical protein D7X32_36940 [Corallococcus carmarthensis]